MKKLALLMVLVLVFSVSCVLATDAVAPLSGEVISGELLVESGETEAAMPEEIVISGENKVVSEEESISGEIVDTNINDNTNSDEAIEDEVIETSNNSATIGAIIAIIIVVAVVAIAAILRKD